MHSAPPAATDSEGACTVEVLRVSAGDRSAHTDQVIEETPIAFVYNGVAFAVMMATPRDLGNFALGFALTEGIVEHPREFELLETRVIDAGVTLQGLIPPMRFESLQQRRRSLAGRSGCGLCGVETLEAAVRVLPCVRAGMRITRAAIAAGMRQLAAAQSLNDATGGAHAAGFIATDGRALVREDVGRHNALDKLVGALAHEHGEHLREHATSGFLAITSRASWEIVHKAAHAGISVIAAISAPTSLAITAAAQAGITLIAFARDEAMNVYTHAGRVT